MPKDKQSETGKEEPKKKMVVVEEVEVEETPDKSQDVVPETEEVNEEKTETPKTEEVSEITDNEDDLEDKPNYLWIIVPTALLVGALVGGLITYFSGISNMGTVEVTPSPIATSTPQEDGNPQTTATPSSNLKRDSLKVQVLNGSGVSGLAGKVKAMLEGLGYESIVVGNASSSDFEKTEVAIKESKKEYLDLVIKDLSSDYEAVEAEKAVPASSSYDVVITVGKK